MPSCSRIPLKVCAVALLLACSCATVAVGADWPRFRGPNGNGVAPDGKAPPVEFGPNKNLKWKLELPGPGLSCPIIVGDRVYLTCWSGYATPKNPDSKIENLKRHLVCIDRKSGAQIWDTPIDAVQPEDPYRGMFAENGYASHTPVCDGERIYAFFGKTGVVAFDMDGKEVWRKNVGKASDERGWGTASSPILYKNMVIVTASVEDHALVALDKTNGSQIWKAPAEGFGSTWGTPVLVEIPDEKRTEVVIGVPGEIWAFDADTGKLRWYCEALGTNSMCSSVVAHDGIIYAVESGGGGGGGGTVAVRAGGKGDVTKTHLLWTGNDRGRIGTPVVFDNRMYWVSNRIAFCVDAKTGNRVYQQRLKESADNAPAAPPERPQGERRGGPGGGPGGRGGPGGGMGGGGRGQDYASPVVANGRLYSVSRSGEIYVVQLGPEYKLLSTNRVAPDSDEYFNSTPAISNGDLFIRSSTTLYCVGSDS